MREVLIRRSRRARRLSLRVDPSRGVPLLVAPPGAGAREIAAFLAAHEGWIARQMRDLPPRRRLLPGADLPLRGVAHRIVHDPVLARCPVIDGGEIRLGGPRDLVEARLIAWLRELARVELGARVGVHAACLGVSSGRITLRDTRSRWGSCSAAGNLNFNWRLILAPGEILDYVAAHEVAHRREMNHSPRFWEHVARLVDDPAGARAWLRRHGRELLLIGPPPAPPAGRDV